MTSASFLAHSFFFSPIHKSDVNSACSIRHTAEMRYPVAWITARPIRPYPSNNPFWLPHRLRNDLRFFPRPSIFSSPIHKSNVDSACSIRYTAEMRYPVAWIIARPTKAYPSNNPFRIPHRLRNDLRFFPPIHKSDVDSLCSIRHTAEMRYPDAWILAKPTTMPCKASLLEFSIKYRVTIIKKGHQRMVSL